MPLDLFGNDVTILPGGERPKGMRLAEAQYKQLIGIHGKVEGKK